MFYNVDNWMRFREEALAYSADIERRIIKEWLDKIGYTEPVGYYRDTINNIMEIYSTRIGMLIGKGGTHVEELKKMLLDEYRTSFEIKFVEIRGGFVNV